MLYVGTRPSTIIINIGAITVLGVVIRTSSIVSDMNFTADFSANIEYSN